MNTRSQTSASANPSASGSASQTSQVIKKNPVDKFIGMKLRGKNHPRIFRFLDEREMKTTKWACPATIQRLGITNDFDLLCNNVGIRDFVLRMFQLTAG